MASWRKLSLSATTKKTYTDVWIDDIAYPDVGEISKGVSARYHNAGVMINGRIYSVNVMPVIETAIPLKDILETDPVGEEYFLHEEDMPKWIYAKGPKHELRTKRDGTQYWFNEGSVQFPEPLDKPSRTMLTSESEVGRTSHVVTDLKTGRLRTLTPRECERLNGFPDDWTNTGMSMKQRYFCMGNALVVTIIKKLGKQLLLMN